MARVPIWERPWEHVRYNPQGPARPTSSTDVRSLLFSHLNEQFEFLPTAGVPSMLKSEQPDSSLPPPTRAAEATSSRTEILVGLLHASLREVGPPIDQPVSGLHPSGIEPAVSSGGGGNVQAMEGRSQPPHGADEGRAARDPPLASTPAQASWHQAHPCASTRHAPHQTPLTPYAHTEICLKSRTVRTEYLTTPGSMTGHGAQELRPGKARNLPQRAGDPRAATHPRRARAQ